MKTALPYMSPIHGEAMTWASYQIRKIVGCACAGNVGNFFRHRFQRKPPVSDLGMHHGTCVTHEPWCMSGSLTRSDGEYLLGIPGACAIRNFTYLARGPWTHFPLTGPLWLESTGHCLNKILQKKSYTDGLKCRNTHVFSLQCNTLQHFISITTNSVYLASIWNWMEQLAINFRFTFNSSPLVPHICVNESGQHYCRYCPLSKSMLG